MSFDGGWSNTQTPQQLHTWLAAPSSNITAYVVLLSILIYYIFFPLNPGDICLHYLWNMLVSLIPIRLIHLLDKNVVRDDVQGSFSQSRSTQYAQKNNALRRILRLENGGIMQAVKRTRPLSNLKDMIQIPPAESPPGLGNWDNSCYQNSVLQGLASLTSLAPFLGSASHGQCHSTTAALRDLTVRLNDKGNRGRTFWTPSKLKNMSSWQQQDAQEYFSKILDEIDKDAAQTIKGHSLQSHRQGLAEAASPAERCRTDCQLSSTQLWTSQLPEELQSIIMRNPLEGLLAQRVGCKRCGYVEGLSLVPFTCLTLPLGKEWIYDIRDCLEDFTALESIDGVECVKCTLIQAERQMMDILEIIRPPEMDASLIVPNTAALCGTVEQRLGIVRRALDDKDFSDNVLKKCEIGPRNRVSTIKSRQAVIARAPKALVLHVNRSEFDEITGTQSKNYAKVSFPTSFNLEPWCLGQTTEIPTSGASIEQWNTHPSLSMLSPTTGEDMAPRCLQYELRAVVTHYGRHENGHYVCYRQAPGKATSSGGPDTSLAKDRKWWRLSDEDVTEVNQKELLDQGGVFMLFYERVEHATAPRTQYETHSLKPTVPVLECPSEICRDEDEPTCTSVAPNTGDTRKETPLRLDEGLPTDTPRKGTPDIDRAKGDDVVPNKATKDSSGQDHAAKSSSNSPSLPSQCESHHENADKVTSTSKPSAGTRLRLPEEALPTPPATPKQSSSSLEKSLPNLHPRSGRGSTSSSGPTMESIPGFVRAN